jgi:hypothetical protein
MELKQKGGMFDFGLISHLMSGDFFNTDKFSTAKFEITKDKLYKFNSSDTSLVRGANCAPRMFFVCLESGFRSEVLADPAIAVLYGRKI